MTTTVRAAQPGEEARILSMYEWLFTPPGSVPPRWDPEWAATAIRETIEGADSVALVAEHRSALLGLCTAYVELRSVRFGTRCWVEDLVVSPEHRSQGVGQGLLDAAKDWGRTHGATHLELDSGESRTEAHRFYEREGPSWRSKQYAWEL